MWLYVYSGLMSRCESLAEAYYLVKKTKHKSLKIIWPKSSDCDIAYKDVFDEKQFEDIKIKIKEIEISQYQLKEGGVVENLHRLRVGKAIWNFCIIFKNKYKEIPVILVEKYYRHKRAYVDYTPPANMGWKGEIYLNYLRERWQIVKEHLTNGNEIYVRTYRGIIRDKEKNKVEKGVVRFKDEYYEEVDKIVNMPDKVWVGVHIRRTDHKTAIQSCSIETFIRKMQEIIEKTPNVKFFLSTDDILVEEQLKEKFADKIVTYKEKKWGRNSENGMKSAIIDCLCLAKCEWILGSYTSAFSKFAAEYGKKELVVCKDEDVKE